jgi:hypothetical protein
MKGAGVWLRAVAHRSAERPAASAEIGIRIGAMVNDAGGGRGVRGIN